jgi:hypothetical protein
MARVNTESWIFRATVEAVVSHVVALLGPNGGLTSKGPDECATKPFEIPVIDVCVPIPIFRMHCCFLLFLLEV